jgi:hypothetical protein
MADVEPLARPDVGHAQQEHDFAEFLQV